MIFSFPTRARAGDAIAVESSVAGHYKERDYPMSKKHLYINSAVGLIAMAVGAGIGAVGSTSTEPAAAKPETVEVSTVPESCASLPDTSEHLVDLLLENLDYVSAAFTAASELDIAGMESAGDDMDALTPKVEKAATAYWADQSDCERAAQ